MGQLFSRVKGNAWQTLKSKYWWFVLTNFLMGLIGIGVNNNRIVGKGSGGSSASSANGVSITNGSIGSASASIGGEVIALVGAFALILVLIIVVVIGVCLAIKIFVLNPIVVGANRYLRDKRESDPAFWSTVFMAFKKEHYMNIVKTMFMMNLFIFLWTLLLIIPGVIAGLRYSQVAYILADDPTMSWSEVLEKSTNMMDGHKWEAFVFGLSFIGWILLCIIPIAGWALNIFWVSPYMRLAYCEYHDELDAMYNRSYGVTA